MGELDIAVDDAAVVGRIKTYPTIAVIHLDPGMGLDRKSVV